MEKKGKSWKKERVIGKKVNGDTSGTQVDTEGDFTSNENLCDKNTSNMQNTGETEDTAQALNSTQDGSSPHEQSNVEEATVAEGNAAEDRVSSWTSMTKIIPIIN